MSRTVFLAILLTYLVISFVPALALPNLMGGLRGGKKA